MNLIVNHSKVLSGMRCFVIVMFLFVSNYVYSATRAEIKLWLDAKDGIMQGQIDKLKGPQKNTSDTDWKEALKEAEEGKFGEIEDV